MVSRERIRARARARRKIPRDVIQLHQAVERVIRVAESKAEERHPRDMWWSTLIDLRDVRMSLESRYPALAPLTMREEAIGEEDDQ